MTKRKTIATTIVAQPEIVEPVATPVVVDAALNDQESLKEIALFNEIQSCIQIGQRVWKKVHMIDTYAIVNICTRIIAVGKNNTVTAEFLYAVVGADKSVIYEVKDSDKRIWKSGVKTSYHFTYLKKHIAKGTANIWWESQSN